MADFLIVFVSVLFDIVSFAIIARVLLSWFPNSGGGQIKAVLHDVTDPILNVFKKLVPRIGMIDITPIVAIIALDIGKTVILSLIYNIFS